MLWSCPVLFAVITSVSLATEPTDRVDQPITADEAAAQQRGESSVVVPAVPPARSTSADSPPSPSSPRRPKKALPKPPRRQVPLAATSVWPVVPSLQLGLAVSDQGVSPVLMADAFVPIIPTLGPWVRVAAHGTAGNSGLTAGELMAGIGVGAEGQLGGVRGRVGAMPVLGVHAYSVEGVQPLAGTPASPLPLFGLWVPAEVELPLGGGTYAIAGATLGYTNAVRHRISGQDVFGRGRIYALVTFGLLFGGAP